jgi:hypothetical protein
MVISFIRCVSLIVTHYHWRPKNVVRCSERDLDFGDVLVSYIQQVRFSFFLTGHPHARFSFDATYLYEYTFILLYNLVFTSLPVMALGGKLP